MNFHTPYRHERMTPRKQDESMTVQSEKDSTDINVIMSKYGATGQLPRVKTAEPQEGDFSAITDYRDALDTVRLAQDHFSAMPAHLRKRFGNNPALFLDFINDEKNHEEARKLGLTNPVREPTIAERTLEELKGIRDVFTPNGENDGTDDNPDRRKKHGAQRPHKKPD